MEERFFLELCHQIRPLGSAQLEDKILKSKDSSTVRDLLTEQLDNQVTIKHIRHWLIDEVPSTSEETSTSTSNEAAAEKDCVSNILSIGNKKKEKRKNSARLQLAERRERAEASMENGGRERKNDNLFQKLFWVPPAAIQISENRDQQKEK